jgi:glutamyl-tRNA reductase
MGQRMPGIIPEAHILCVGVNHQTASVALRERLAFSTHRLEQALTHSIEGNESAAGEIEELVILSTCNRVEVYAVSQQPAFDLLEAFLSEPQNIPACELSPGELSPGELSPGELSPSLYHLMDGDAIKHLFRVAAGLDSLVIGEPQILGQVAQAYEAAKQNGSAGKILSQLFQAAIRAGKRTHTETTISRNPASIASVAVHLISETVPDLPSARVLVLGAGEMAELSVESLRKRGVKEITVINRTLEKAQELARRWDGQAGALYMLPEYLPDMDIVISSTGAPHTIIQRELVHSAVRERPNRPLVFMDIAVPRDVDEGVRDLAGVRLFDMDQLSETLHTSLAQRQSQVPRVEAILAEEQAAFEAYLAALNVVPIIVELREQANSIRQNEVEKALRRMPQLTPEMERQIEALTISIVNKILHSPTSRLREEAQGPQAGDYADITRYLFGLE